MTFPFDFPGLRPGTPDGGNERIRGRVRRGAAGAVATLLLASGLVAPVLADSPAGAQSIASLRARALSIATEIDSVQAKLNVLSEEYDQASNRLATIRAGISGDRASIGSSRRQVARDNSHLRSEAVIAYVNAGSAGSLEAVMSTNVNSMPLQQTYLQVASGSLDTAISSVKDSEHQLAVHEATLHLAETAAQRTTDELAQARSSAESLEGQLASTLANVKGALAAQVAAAEQAAAARQAAAQAAAVTARLAAEQASQASNAAASTTTTTTAPAAAAPAAPAAPAVNSGGGSGSAAVQAAESQIGVPYVWAGATPGVGFDCSGLTMWAWGRAGVNLPHSAQSQYDSIEHVSLSELEPGDLVFYASSGYIYHVVMYIGGGQVVQAMDTGTLVQITPLWPGAYGAGRP